MVPIEWFSCSLRQENERNKYEVNKKVSRPDQYEDEPKTTTTQKIEEENQWIDGMKNQRRPENWFSSMAH